MPEPKALRACRPSARPTPSAAASFPLKASLRGVRSRAKQPYAVAMKDSTPFDIDIGLSEFIPQLYELKQITQAREPSRLRHAKL